jgi:predicted nucleic acid-binding protein
VSRLVVDASVVLPWFLPERFSVPARSLLEQNHQRIAPELLFSEVNHSLVRRVRSRVVERALANTAIATLAALVSIRASSYLALRAMELALRFERSAYDALYVAFAVDHSCQFVTADRALYDATVRAFPGIMVWVEEAPDLV